MGASVTHPNYYCSVCIASGQQLDSENHAFNRNGCNNCGPESSLTPEVVNLFECKATCKYMLNRRLPVKTSSNRCLVST